VALAWVVQQPGVTTVIPGARSVDQAHANAAAGELPALDAQFLAAVEDIYDRHLREAIHHRW
jgi:aryl-alcohol dehydrogenase-like predicted oxidoreductase